MQDIEMSQADHLLTSELDNLQDLVALKPENAIPKLRELTKTPKLVENDNGNLELEQFFERALNLLIKSYTFTADANSLITLLASLKPVFPKLSKSKRENLVKSIFSNLASIPETQDLQKKLCNEYISYFETTRPLLSQYFETKLASLLVEENAADALSILSTLQAKVKKLDDKLLLVEINLIESKARYLLNNMAKSRSTLTAARTNANQVYVPVELQAEIDLQSGVINAHEKDFKTSYSYFLESFDAFQSLRLRNKKRASVFDAKAVTCFRYMILSKLMDHEFAAIAGILATKFEYASDPIVSFLNNLGVAVKEKNLQKYSTVFEAKPDNTDTMIVMHLTELKDNLLEKNLLKIIRPYDKVEIDRVAELIQLPQPQVMAKLSQMILDKKFAGILDQGAGELIVHEKIDETKYGKEAVEFIENMEDVVDTLIKRARALHVA